MNTVSTRPLLKFVGMAVALPAAVLVTGCATPGGTRVESIAIYASTPQRVTIHNAAVPVQNLGRKLGGLGANRHTRIMLNVAENADPNTGPLLMERLVRLGYPKVVVARKQRPQVVVTKPEGRFNRRR